MLILLLISACPSHHPPCGVAAVLVVLLLLHLQQTHLHPDATIFISSMILSLMLRSCLLLLGDHPRLVIIFISHPHHRQPYTTTIHIVYVQHLSATVAVTVPAHVVVLDIAFAFACMRSPPQN
jgi:hypothetical protein